MPHRFSRNQLLVIVPDRLVHPQPQRWATGAETHWMSTENSQNCVTKTQRVFFFTCDTLYTWRHTEMNKVNVRYIYDTLEYIYTVEFASCFLWLVAMALEKSGDSTDNKDKIKKSCRWWKRKRRNYFLAMLSWISGTGMWEEKAPVYMSNGLCICVQEEDYV